MRERECVRERERERERAGERESERSTRFPDARGATGDGFV